MYLQTIKENNYEKIVCLFLAAAFLLLAGCQADDSSKTYTTDEIILKIETDKNRTIEIKK